MSLHRMPELFRIILCAAVFCASSTAYGQDKQISTDTIRFIVAFAPGGGADIVARFIADRMSTVLNQTAIVENRPGAAGVIAAHQVANSDPNGLTILVASNPLLINQVMKSDSDFDMFKELTPVASVAPQSIVIVATPSLPVISLKDLMKLAETRTINYGTTGTGSLSHLAVAYLALSQPNAKLQHIPFTGGAPALTAAMAGQVDLAASTVPPAASLISSGKLKALAVASSSRSTILPNVPTYAESGLKPLPVGTSWTGFFVPKATPPAMVQKLSKVIVDLSTTPESQEKFKQLGFEPDSVGAEEFARQLSVERGIWTDVVAKLGLNAPH
jgi:tripartite-type tricarboxylate transporter receptor subunit TctC